MIKKKSNKITFESAFKELEEILTKVENNELTLEELVDAFEKGTELSNFCLKKIENAKLKISAIKK